MRLPAFCDPVFLLFPAETAKKPSGITELPIARKKEAK